MRKSESLDVAEPYTTTIQRFDKPPHTYCETTLIPFREKADEHIERASHKLFEELYSEYNRAIYLKIFTLVKVRDTSKDLCQEVFIKAWINLSTYNKQKGEIHSWLMTIAVNHCIDYFRSKNYRSQRNSFSIDQINSYKIKHEAFNLDRFDVFNLLSKLDRDHKELIELLFLKGFTQIEVAKIKKLPLGTVKTKSRKALGVLKTIAYK